LRDAVALVDGTTALGWADLACCSLIFMRRTATVDQA
jgi:hypothetical protein